MFYLEFEFSSINICFGIDNRIDIRLTMEELPLKLNFDNDVISFETISSDTWGGDSHQTLIFRFEWRNYTWSEQYENHCKWIKQAYER
jgi:hypothetical protein